MNERPNNSYHYPPHPPSPTPFPWSGAHPPPHPDNSVVKSRGAACNKRTLILREHHWGKGNVGGLGVGGYRVWPNTEASWIWLTQHLDRLLRGSEETIINLKCQTCTPDHLFSALKKLVKLRVSGEHAVVKNSWAKSNKLIKELWTQIKNFYSTSFRVLSSCLCLSWGQPGGAKFKCCKQRFH